MKYSFCIYIIYYNLSIYCIITFGFPFEQLTMAKSFADSVAPANDATNLNNFFLKKLAFKNLTSSSTVASVNTNDDIKGNHRIRKFNHPRLESSDGDDDCDNQVSEANATK